MRIAFKTVSSLIAGCGLLLLSAGCQQATNVGGDVSSANSRATELAVLQQKRQDYEGKLKAMNNVQLIQEMGTDAGKGREPFNSAAYREIVSHGKGAGADLKSQLTRKDSSSLLTLLALRQVDAESYHALDPAFRVGVLIDSLKTSKYYNTWGIPGLYWEDAAKAVIDEGPAATEPLIGLLRDTRPAPVFGSEGATISSQYHYRVCDYALALLTEIRHQKVDLPIDPTQRDHIIDTFPKA